MSDSTYSAGLILVRRSMENRDFVAPESGLKVALKAAPTARRICGKPAWRRSIVVLQRRNLSHDHRPNYGRVWALSASVATGKALRMAATSACGWYAAMTVSGPDALPPVAVTG
jgi:hypothetical protein